MQRQRRGEKWRRLLAILLVAAFGFGCVATSGFAQDDERRLWDAEFLKKRQPAKTTTARKPPVYRRTTPTPAAADKATDKAADKTTDKTTDKAADKATDKAADKATEKAADKTADKPAGEMIGVTVWRLRPSNAADGKESRLLLQDEDKDGNEWTPQRVEAETSFAADERVRLSIESSRGGYLYVIDREQYADGTTSDPYLIFPTLRLHDGDNSVAAGKVIELPERNAFRLKSPRPDYRGEQLTLIVTAEPLAQITVGPRMQKLDARQVEQWERQWAAPVERFEMVGGAGKSYTKAEKEAGAEGRLLTQEDELPQTLYRLTPKPGVPLLISVPLRVGK